MNHADALAVYRSTFSRFWAIDCWFFKQDPHPFDVLRAARAEKISPVLEDTTRALQQLLPWCDEKTGHPDAKANLDVLARLHSLLDSERAIASFLQNTNFIDELQSLNVSSGGQSYYAAGGRAYSYLIWAKSVFPTASDLPRNGISAVLRVKNESQHLRLMLPILVTYFDELIVVDHNSADDTYAYVASLNHPKIKLSRYLTPTATAGEFYTHELKAGKGSLADYYNFAFGLATCAYVCKWDADMYPLPALREVLDAVRADASVDVVEITGVDCYGYTSCGPEMRLYKRSREFRYIDMPYYEYLNIEGDNTVFANVTTPVYLHMKQCKVH